MKTSSVDVEILNCSKGEKVEADDDHNPSHRLDDVLRAQQMVVEVV